MRFGELADRAEFRCMMVVGWSRKKIDGAASDSVIRVTRSRKV